jgi:lipopolysaccharide/colanic/teichoic acid biosynthesis glycosyltransferase
MYGLSQSKRERIDSEALIWIIPIEEFPSIGLRKVIKSKSASFYIKQMLDKVVSFLLLIPLFPIFIIIGLVIFLSSKGPVFFKQNRVGLDGTIFKMIKFRTMVSDAEKRKAGLTDRNEVSGPVFKMEKDPRVTRVGRLLRRTGLDELPQFWNVLKGDMSIIGPRPPLESEVRQYEKWQMRRLSVKPGITCTWQIHKNRHSIPFEEWMQMDLDYIDNWTVKEDGKIFVKTIETIFSGSSH